MSRFRIRSGNLHSEDGKKLHLHLRNVNILAVCAKFISVDKTLGDDNKNLFIFSIDMEYVVDKILIVSKN